MAERDPRFPETQNVSLQFGRKGGVNLGVPGIEKKPDSITYLKTKTDDGWNVEPIVPEKERLDLSFFQRLTTSGEEVQIVDALMDLVTGDELAALRHARKGVDLADGAFLAGFLALRRDHYQEAVEYLTTALDKCDELNEVFVRYKVQALVTLPITDELIAVVTPDSTGVLLGLTEAYQRLKQWDKALACLQHIIDAHPEEVVVLVSFAELLLESAPQEPSTYERILQVSEHVENKSQHHAALMLYRAKAQRHLHQNTEAVATLSKALEEETHRPKRLQCALLYELAEAYLAVEEHQQARNYFTTCFELDPDYRDVVARLNQ